MENETRVTHEYAIEQARKAFSGAAERWAKRAIERRQGQRYKRIAGDAENAASLARRYAANLSTATPAMEIQEASRIGVEIEAFGNINWLHIAEMVRMGEVCVVDAGGVLCNRIAQ